MPLALVLGLVHATVDAATVTAVFRATGFDPTIAVAFAWVLTYDLLAFGLQPVLGWLQDRRFSPRVGMVAGLAATASAVLVASTVPGARGAPAVVVVLAAFGNAMFHLGAGAAVLRQGLERATPIGLLVAPGAAGLALGVWFGRGPQIGPTWWALLAVLAGALLTAFALRLPPRADPSPPGRPGRRDGLGERMAEPVRAVAGGVIGLLLASVAIRALVGGAATRGYDRSLWLVIGVPVVAVAGKSLGGVLADRWGWVRTTVGALLVASPVLAVLHSHPAVVLLGLLVFQLTMPVTLVAVARMVPEHLATGFGLTCLALVLGAIPTMFGWGDAVVARPVLGVWVLISAAVAWAGLTGSGLQWRRTPPARSADGWPVSSAAPAGPPVGSDARPVTGADVLA